MNTPGLRDPVVMRVLSDFYCLVCLHVKQRHADHCVQAARAPC